MVTANIHDIKARFSHFSRLVKSGERVVICERNKPFAEMHLLAKPGRRLKRRLGQLKGLCPVGPDFWTCDGEIASDMLGGPVFPPPKP